MKEIHSFNIKIHPLRKIDFIQIIDESIKSNTQLVQSGVNAASIVEIKKQCRFSKCLQQRRSD